jgi:hypothetical protein
LHPWVAGSDDVERVRFEDFLEEPLAVIHAELRVEYGVLGLEFVANVVEQLPEVHVLKAWALARAIAENESWFALHGFPP